MKQRTQKIVAAELAALRKATAGREATHDEQATAAALIAELEALNQPAPPPAPQPAQDLPPAAPAVGDHRAEIAKAIRAGGMVPVEITSNNFRADNAVPVPVGSIIALTAGQAFSVEKNNFGKIVPE